MNSKIILILLSVSLLGCTDFFHGKNEKPEILKIQIVDAACSLDFKTQIQKVFRSEANEQQINQTFDCLDQYLSQFQNRVEGQSAPDIYDVQDLQYITGRFFKDLNLNAEAIKKIVLLKQALIGGSDQVLTKNEVSTLKEYLKVIRQEVVILSPYFKLLGIYRIDAEVSEDLITTATAQLQKSLKVIIGKSNLDKTNYSYQDAKDLLQAIGFVTETDKVKIMSFDRMRNLLLGDQVLTTKADYSLFIENIADAHKLYLRALYGYLNCEMSSLSTIQQTAKFFDDVVNLLESTFQFRRTGRVNTYNVDQVIELLVERNIFPFHVKFGTFRDFYKVALKKVFSQETTEFLTSKSFEAYRHESELFKLEVDFLLEKVSDQSLTLTQTRDRFSNYISNQVWGRVSSHFSDTEKQKIITDLIDLHYDLYHQQGIALKERQFIISKQQSTLKFSALDIVHGFYIKMLSRELLRGWGNGQRTTQLINAELSLEGMISFMKDFDQFGIELKLNDPRSKNDGTKNFIEADLMGFYSDGNRRMSMFETFEYLHYLVAEGAWGVSAIQNHLKTLNCNLSELDVFGIPYSNEPCFYADMKHNYSKYFKNKPGLVKFLSQLSDAQFLEYYTLVMDVGRFDPKNKYIKVETVDVQNFVVLTGYIEAMMTKYDINSNNRLSAEEIRQAYPRYKNFATDFSTKNAADSLAKWDSWLNYCHLIYSKEDLIRESFIFMVLNNGKTPTISDVNYVTCAKNGIFTFNNEVDRKDIINTFFVLKSVLASP